MIAPYFFAIGKNEHLTAIIRKEKILYLQWLMCSSRRKLWIANSNIGCKSWQLNLHNAIIGSFIETAAISSPMNSICRLSIYSTNDYLENNECKNLYLNHV